MNIEKIRNLTDVELVQQEREIGEQLFKLKFQLKMGQTESLNKIRTLRKDVARIKTIAGERLLGLGNGDAAAATAAKSAALESAEAAEKKAASAKAAKKPVAKKAAVKAKPKVKAKAPVASEAKDSKAKAKTKKKKKTANKQEKR